MFKLPQLQPQLTGTASVEGRARSLTSYSGFASQPRSLREGLQSAPPGGTIEVKSWELQAREITADISSSDKYKSLSLHAEVKLAEALERCTRVSPTAYTATGEERPNKLKTAVCCQLLGEFSELCGPFAGVLKSLRDELLKSVYSGYYVSERGLLVFDQLTWFAVAERLEQEKKAMLAERELFQQQLTEQQDCLLRIEEQLGTYQRAMLAAQTEAASMKSHLEGMSATKDAAMLEAKTGREELKRARKDYLKMKDEIDTERDAHQKLKVVHEEATANFKQQMKDSYAYQDQLKDELVEARKQIDIRLPPEAVQGLKGQLEEGHKQLDSAKARAEELAAKLKALEEQTGTMTPRPIVPPQLVDHGINVKVSTRETLTLAAAKLDEFAADKGALHQRLEQAQQQHQATQEQMRLLEAVLLPDPMPRSVQLSVTTDSSHYFITEGEDPEGSGGAAPALAAEGLGLLQDVPRCLRWPAAQVVQMQHMDQQATEALVAQIWESKQDYDRSHVKQHLLSFLYEYFARLAPEACPDHATVAKHSYSLFHACSSYGGASTSVQLFSAVLTGNLSEQAWADQQAMRAGLFQVLSALPSTSSGPGAGVSVQDMQDTIQHFFPTRSALQIRRLKEAAAAVLKEDSVPLEGLKPLLLSRHHTAHAGVSAEHGAALVELLNAQHLEELEAFGEEVMAAVELEQARAVEGAAAEGAASGKQLVALGSLATALQTVMPRDEVLLALQHAMGLVGLGQGLDLATAAPKPVDAPTLLRLLRALCLLRPGRNWDLAGALAWVQAGSARQGASSLAALPDVA